MRFSSTVSILIYLLFALHIEFFNAKLPAITDYPETGISWMEREPNNVRNACECRGEFIWQSWGAVNRKFHFINWHDQFPGRSVAFYLYDVFSAWAAFFWAKPHLGN